MNTDVRDLDIRPDGATPWKRPVKVTKGHFLSPMVLGYVERFQRFQPGDSFFVAGVTPKDMEFLRRPFLSAGLGVIFRAVEVDEIHGVAGVRVQRELGSFDNL